MSIMIIAAGWESDDEAAAQDAFAGKSGWMLRNLLAQIGVDLRQCATAEVFRKRLYDPVKDLCGAKIHGVPGMTAIERGKYVRGEFAPHLTALYQRIDQVNPNLIITLGNIPTWALTNMSGIKALRGSPAISTAPTQRPYKIIPTYPPMAVMREWPLRPVVLADLDKARRLSVDPDFVRPSRLIWVEPNVRDLAIYQRDHISPAMRLSIDIETRNNQITCIGFAPSPASAIVIPFYIEPGISYWKTKEEEVCAWGYVRRWCAIKPSVFQNGMYDMHHLWRSYGIRVPRQRDDTMLAHHAMQMEMEKSLGFLGSLYTDEPSWKFMRKVETLKKDD